MYGGRWNYPGVEVVYAASTVSLAALEVLANYRVLPTDFGLTEIEISDLVSTAELVFKDVLKADSYTPREIDIQVITQAYGQKWVRVTPPQFCWFRPYLCQLSAIW